MPRKMSEKKELEFESLSEFIDYFSTNVLEIDQNAGEHPSNSLVGIVDEFGKSKALIGLKQAVNDAIEMTSHWDIEAVRKLDDALHANGIVTLSALRRKYWGRYKRILNTFIL